MLTSHKATRLRSRDGVAPEEREALLKLVLPSKEDAPVTRRTSRRNRRKPIRSTIKHGVHVFLYATIQFFFSIYLHIRMAFRAIKYRFYSISFYHHRTPELINQDVKKMSKIPNHLSVILKLNNDEDKRTNIQRLINEVGELTAWCASAGIPVLSVYEKTGLLKAHIPHTHSAILKTLQRYFPPTDQPALRLRAPNSLAYSPPGTPPPQDTEPFQIHVLLISENDGRQTMVDLAKTLAEMAQKGKLTSAEVTTEVVDAELAEGVMGEPDLLILFGDRVVLDGYPPWQVRLTEIFHLPDHTEGLSYSLFLRALYKYSGAQMRLGS